MNTEILGTIAIVGYAAAAILQYFNLLRGNKSGLNKVLLLGTVALACHFASFQETLFSVNGINLGLFQVSSLTGWLIAALVTLSSITKPLGNLLIGIYPLALLGLILGLINVDTAEPLQNLSLGISSHIILSILAYSTFSIAVLQALLLAFQDQHLHHQKANGFIMRLPPLQMMEQLLFDLILVGLALLSAAIVSGILFLEDIFAQHLVHKTVLTLIAWVIFSTLLFGRHWLGWRGTKAIHWTLGGYLLLLLAFFGSKLVLEIILQRSI